MNSEGSKLLKSCSVEKRGGKAAKTEEKDMRAGGLKPFGTNGTQLV